MNGLSTSLFDKNGFLMSVTLSLQNWVDALRSLAPIAGLVHVGASVGQAVIYAEWGVPSAVLIEADEGCRDKLAAVAAAHHGWSAHAALLSDREGDLDFYVATNPNENGVVQPERFASLWRNLRTKEQLRVKASTLHSLLSTVQPTSEAINWVVIDCLPALPIIRGAGQRMDDWDVIIARVVLDESQMKVADAAKSELDVFLSAYGYRCVALEEERHPAIGRALYVRDWKILLHVRLQNLERAAADQAEAKEQLQKANEEQTRLAVDCRQQVVQLTIAIDEQTRLAIERQGQLEQATAAKDEQAQFAAEQRQQVEQLNITIDEQTRLATERQAQLEQVIVAKDEQTRLAAERQQQVEQLTITIDEQTRLVAERQAQLEQVTVAKDEQTRLGAEHQRQVAQLTHAKDEQTRLANERQRQLAETQKRFQLFEVQHVELASRQTPLQEEIIRAEAQIDLIKDLLFREPGL